jgi:hypothetical protein
LVEHIKIVDGSRIFGGGSFHRAVIPAKAGIHLALMQDQHGFPLSRE